MFAVARPDVSYRKVWAAQLVPWPKLSPLSGLHPHPESSCPLCSGLLFGWICSQLFPRPSVVNQHIPVSQKPLCEASFQASLYSVQLVAYLAQLRITSSSIASWVKGKVHAPRVCTYQNLPPDFEPGENISESATIKKKKKLICI